MRIMFKIKPLKVSGIHEVFDMDLKNSYEVMEGDNVIGYVQFYKNKEKSIWVEYIQAKEKGKGDGRKIIQALFELGYEKIEGTAIYGPHFFWIEVGAVFEEEPQEDIYDGFSFELTKNNFKY